MGRLTLSITVSQTLHGILLSSLFVLSALAQPATLSFNECTSGNPIDPALKINVSTVYGQIVTGEDLGRHLNLTVIGNTGQDIIPLSNTTGKLTTLFTTSNILSFNVLDAGTFFCTTLRPASPLSDEDPSFFYCPVSTGSIAFSATIPLKRSYELMTIDTRLRIVDTSLPAVELACIDVATTPLQSHGNTTGSIYGKVEIVFWFSVVLALAYWAVNGLARAVASWDRGSSGSDRNLFSRLQGAGYILASAISGERFSTTPALLRFCTPSMRDIFFHSQFCAIVGMIAVQWPMFAYPTLAQTAWSTLLFNVTLAQNVDQHWNPLTVQDYNPSSDFSDQLNDQNSAIFIDSTVPNELLMFPEGTTAGMASLAASVGLRPQDLFGVCIVLFLAIVAGVIVLSSLIWGIDRLGIALFGREEKDSPFAARTTAYVPPKDSDKTTDEDGTSTTMGHFLFRAPSIPLSSTLVRGKWWRLRFKPSSFHGSLLHGNLVRILVLFHLPLTIFSSYQFANATTQSSLASVILAVISFAVLSIGVPVFLIIRLYTTATNKLYDETRTLMMLGPLYNHFGHGSQLFACIFFANSLIYGITIGCGQKSGTAQAIIVLVTEVATSLSTSIWLPWGRGATMGLISFFFCVGRITVAVLLVILTPTVSVGVAAGSWVAAAILFILGLMYLGFLIILAIKLFEATLRIIGRIPFDRSKHTLDSGILGVLGLLGCCSPRKRKHRRNPRVPAKDPRAASQLESQQPFVLGKKDSSLRSSSHGPPSVLRPEQAFRPYREDSDDESGFIMGSWHPFPQSGYGPLDDRATSPPAETPAKSTGFTRVGGGRARYDAPYAIQGSSSSAAPAPKHEFPSVERLDRTNPSPMPWTSDSPSIRSTVTVNRQLPPGAMTPSRPTVHVRKKSQTAIIEDASSLYNPQAGTSVVIQNNSNNAPTRPAFARAETDDSSSDATQPKRSWIPSAFRTVTKNRRMSEGSLPAMTKDDNGGRSFVVIRDKKAVAPTSSNMEPDSTATGEEEGRGSFVVLRENVAGGSKPSRRLSHA